MSGPGKGGPPEEFNVEVCLAILDLLEDAISCPLEAAVTVAGTLLSLSPTPEAAMFLLEILAACTDTGGEA